MMNVAESPFTYTEIRYMLLVGACMNWECLSRASIANCSIYHIEQRQGRISPPRSHKISGVTALKRGQLQNSYIRNLQIFKNK